MTKARTLADNFAADINQVNAGVGITGGGTSGTVTITNDMATTINAAGDLLYGTANDAYTRLGIGTAGQYLKVNSGATAPEWATLSAGGMTLLSTTTLSGNVVNVTSISQDYTHLFLEWYGVTNTVANDEYVIRLNGSGSGHYLGAVKTSASATMRFTNDSMRILADANNTYTNANNGGGIWVYNYAAAHRTTFAGASIFNDSGAGAVAAVNFAGGFDSASAITSVTFATRGGESINAGTLKIYGVK